MFRIDTQGIAELAQDFQRRARQASLQGIQIIEALAAEEAPHRSGSLQAAITTASTPQGGQVYVSGAAPYAVHVHEGTGLFGPRRERIRPTNKRALMWPGASHPVRSIAGMRPNPFMDRAALRAGDLVAAKYYEVMQSD